MKKYCILCLFSTFASLSASSFYSPSVDEYNNISTLISRIKAILPQNAVLQNILHTEAVNNTVHGVFVTCSLNGSATIAPNADVLGIIGTHPDEILYFHELIMAKPDSFSLDDDAFFFDSNTQKILFSVGYEETNVEDAYCLQELEIAIVDGKIETNTETVLKTSRTEPISSYEHELGKICIYEILCGDLLSVYMKNNKIFEYELNSAVSAVSLVTLRCNQTKHFYKYVVDTKTGLTQLYWVNPTTYLLESTNFMDKFCSLLIPRNNNALIINPYNPAHILGQLIWDGGLLKPEWYDNDAHTKFLKVEEEIRNKLKADSCLFSHVTFNYLYLKLTIENNIEIMRGDFQIVGSGDSINFAHTEYGTSFSLFNPNLKKLALIKNGWVSYKKTC